MLIVIPLILAAFAAMIIVLQRMPATPVLKYHHVNQNTPDAITISPELFEKQLSLLKKLGYRSVSPEEAFLQKKAPRRSVVLTFDDGFFDNYKFAFPLLKKHGFKATIFLTTSLIKDNIGGKVKRESFKDAILKGDFSEFLSWKQIKEMRDSGLVDFQPHTHFHRHRFKGPVVVSKVIDPEKLDFKTLSCFDPPAKKGAEVLESGASIVTRAYDPNTLRYETQKDYLQRIDGEIGASKKIIEKKLNKLCECLAWPWGLFNGAALKAARRLGFKLCMTTIYGSNHFMTSKFRIKRFTPSGDPEKFREEIVRNSFLLSSLLIDDRLYAAFSMRFIRRKLKEMEQNG